jgi:hypothetical protein
MSFYKYDMVGDKYRDTSDVPKGEEKPLLLGIQIIDK